MTASLAALCGRRYVFYVVSAYRRCAHVGRSAIVSRDFSSWLSVTCDEHVCPATVSREILDQTCLRDYSNNHVREAPGCCEKMRSVQCSYLKFGTFGT